jgi:hypothetical protein
MKKINKVFGKEKSVTATRAVLHDYHGMMLDFSVRQQEIIRIGDFIMDVPTEYPG